jgi:hypothetical protein
MRPKKRVLLYCADAVAVEQLGLVLEVRSTLLRVTAVSSVEGFVQAASRGAFDCVVVYRSTLGETPLVSGRFADEQVYELLRGARSGGVVVELMDGLQFAPYSCAHKLVSGKVGLAMHEVVNAVVMACARKHGPYTALDVRRGFSLAADRMVA